jgi:hypothetical protein
MFGHDRGHVCGHGHDCDHVYEYEYDYECVHIHGHDLLWLVENGNWHGG